MIYSLDDRMPIKHILLYGFQELLAIIVATTLISTICGVPINTGLLGAGISTVIYLLITKGKSNIYVSNSGCFVAPVLLAFATGNATATIIGGIVICVIYSVLGMALDTQNNVHRLYEVLPVPLIAAVTMLIGLNLIGFIPTYLGNTGNWGMLVACVTAVSTILTMYYSKGKFKTIPFLIGVGVGYIASLVITLLTSVSLVNFSYFYNVSLISFPTLNFTHLGYLSMPEALNFIVIFAAYALSGACEVIADHQAMSAVIGENLFHKAGIKRIFVGMGVANLVSGIVSGLGQTSYGEATGVVAASKVSNARVSLATALMLITMSFCGYVQALLTSIPSCVFAGASFILYPLITISGLKMLITHNVNLDNPKTMLLVGVPIAIGLSGISIGYFTGVSLALISGMVLNFILKGEN